ncbi:DUF3180 domain-containing protein [Nocardioides mesophilus]|uniref:DUF3180 domain-containing protein n=1 Tax=Nocardioides mesophilus TaxID=433659 RepID=A0A7G9R6I5_9ACTN|nr:DUF3180 domain-containing protein [Nocardioides mesophilus]QNN51210.1 DUF3180 domain-containing protein [Nocardioides mesophilus]
MSRQTDPEDEPVPEPPGPAGRVGPTPPGLLLGLALAGLVLGWLVRPACVRLGVPAPRVSWLPVLALLLVALILGAVAWSTYRSLQKRGERLEPHRAVNRLVLAKACALTGAVVAGGYLGYALSWVGLTDAELGQQRLVRSLVAGLAGVAIVASSLVLERACRIRDGGDENLR